MGNIMSLVKFGRRRSKKKVNVTMVKNTTKENPIKKEEATVKNIKNIVVTKATVKEEATVVAKAMVKEKVIAVAEATVKEKVIAVEEDSVNLVVEKEEWDRGIKVLLVLQKIHMPTILVEKNHFYKLLNGGIPKARLLK